MRLPDRAVISLTGPDALALLERTVTHRVAGWDEGEWRYGALLTPQGKVIVDYLAERTAEGVRLDAPEGAADDLIKRLKLFRLRAAVEIAREPGLAVLADGEGAPDPRSAALPHRRFGRSEGAGVPDSGWVSARIRAGVAEWGTDFGPVEIFPTDINMDLMQGVDYKKGCFVGQEVASRMKRRGKIRKRTLIVRGRALVKGATIAGDGEIGIVTSADRDNGQGLALLRLDRLQKALDLGLPFTSSGEAVNVEIPGWALAEMAALTAETNHE